MLSLAAARKAARAHWQASVLAAVVVASLVFRIYVSNRCSLWLDEVWTVHDASASWPDLLRGPAREHPQLMFWFVRVSMALFGKSELAVRAPSLLFGCVLLVAVYLLCIELELGATRGLVVAVSLAVSPFFLNHATEARQYAMFPAFITLATLFTLRLLRRPHDFGAFTGFAVTGAAAAACQYFGLAYAGALLGVIGWERWRAWRRGVSAFRISARVALVGGASAVAYGIIAVQAIRLAYFYAHHTVGPPTGRLLPGLLSEFSFLHEFPLARDIEPFVAAVGLAVLAFRRRGVAGVIPFALAFGPCACAFLISSGHKVAPRYLAPSFVFCQLGATVALLEVSEFVAGHAGRLTPLRVLRALPAAVLFLLPFGLRFSEYPAGFGTGLDFYAGLQAYFRSGRNAGTALVVFPQFPGEFIVQQGYPVDVPVQTLETFRPLPGVRRYVIAEFERPSLRREFNLQLSEHLRASRRRFRLLPLAPLPRTKFQPPVHARLLMFDE